MARRSVKQLVNAGTEHIKIAHTKDEDGDLVLCTFDARGGFKATRPRLLASADNPGGYAVDELLAQLRAELAEDSGHAGSILQ